MEKCNINLCVFENYQSLRYLVYGGAWGQGMKEEDRERKSKFLKSSIPELPNTQSGSHQLKINPIFLSLAL